MLDSPTTVRPLVARHDLPCSLLRPQWPEERLAQSRLSTDISVDCHKESTVPFPLAWDKFRVSRLESSLAWIFRC